MSLLVKQFLGNLMESGLLGKCCWYLLVPSQIPLNHYSIIRIIMYTYNINEYDYIIGSYKVQWEFQDPKNKGN